jgi:hypothetical protein
VGTIFEDSHIPLSKWLLASFKEVMRDVLKVKPPEKPPKKTTARKR